MRRFRPNGYEYDFVVPAIAGGRMRVRRGGGLFSYVDMEKRVPCGQHPMSLCGL